MALQKYGQSEKAEVFRGSEAEVVNQHMSRVGKAVSEFDESELDALTSELEAVRGTSDGPSVSAQNEESQNDAVDAEADASSAKRSSKPKAK